MDQQQTKSNSEQPTAKGVTRVKLTPGRIDGFECQTGKSQEFHRDTEIPSLAVRVTSAGEKSFVFESKLGGKTLRLTIGGVHTKSIAEARKIAGAHKTSVDAGIDPRNVVARSIEREASERLERKREGATLGEMWQEYLVAPHPKWKTTRSLADHQAIAKPPGIHKRTKKPTMAGPLYSLLKVKLVDLTDKVIADWLAKHSKDRSTQAALAFRLLRAAINWAHDQASFEGLVPGDAIRKAKQGVKKPGTKDGDCLQREQVKLWFQHVRLIRNPVIAAYLQCLLLTGARRTELSSLKWDDVDLRWSSMVIRDKVDGTRAIPLTPHMKALLLDLKRRNETPPPTPIRGDVSSWNPSPWVFPSATSASGHLSEPRIEHVAALGAAGLPHISIHGLRRSFGTLSEWVECPAGVAAQIQGHKPQGVREKNYIRRPLDLLRKWHVQIEAWILKEAGIEQPTESEQSTGLCVVNAA